MNQVTASELGNAFVEYMEAAVEMDRSLIQFAFAKEEDESAPLRDAAQARLRRDSAADQVVAILLLDALTARDRYHALRNQLRDRMDLETWRKTLDNLLALDQTLDARLPRAWAIALFRRYATVVAVAFIAGAICF